MSAERRPRSVISLAVLVLALLLAPGIARAQTGKISGLITDAESGQPIEGVQVVVQGTGLGAVTQANGRYFIVSVPPGTYTVMARRIGYQSEEISNVSVRIDVTRTVDFRLHTAAGRLATQHIVAEAAPLVEQGVTGSATTITADVIQGLPVTNISGVLALQQGFVEVPLNTELQSLAEQQRATVVPIRVRGGRGGATITLVDGIPVNNPLFGYQAVDPSALAVQQVDFVRGYMEPQYGNGLSGIINTALREGGTEIQGAIDYQTTAVAGAFGSTADKLNGAHLLRGFFSGPVPATGNRLRYAVSGQFQNGASRVLQFDNDVFSYDRPFTGAGLPPNPLDQKPGWIAFGGTQNEQIIGKFTALPSTSNKLNFTVISQQRQNLPYDRRFLLVDLAGASPLNLARTTMDSLGLLGFQNYSDVLQSSVRDHTQIYIGSFEQRFGRSSLTLQLAQTDFQRTTCNIFLGVCVPTPMTIPNFTEQFIAPFPVIGVPFFGTDLVYGGEKYTTRMARADLRSQVTDHHNLQTGISYLVHDIVYAEKHGIGGNSGPAPIVNQLYRAKPIEAALYAQDRIEYDFLTIKLGARYDYGLARGRGFANPLDPTNGTTAREVCEGTARGFDNAPFTYTDPSTGTTYTGLAACNVSPKNANQVPVLLDSATRLAQRDDFRAASARKAFSPRIGVSFPLSEHSSVYFNAGRYTMNPLYANLYRNSGVGTHPGPADGFCNAGEVKPGTNECVPPLQPNNPDYIGNPNLRLEEATQYEVGYGAEFGRGYAINVALYNRDETGLSGLRKDTSSFDIGLTYAGSNNPSYFTIVNQDFLTSRGIEIQFRRRLRDYWGYDINYGWSRTTTNSPPPDRSFEIEAGGEIDRTALREIVSDVDQPQRFNATLQFGAQNDVPPGLLGDVLRNLFGTITFQYQSGFPYTPVRALTLGGVTNTTNAADVNTGRGPATQQVNLLIQKRFQIANVQYGTFVRVSNLFDRKNCVQVFVSTGTCDSGLRDPLNRRVGNFDETTSTNTDQPEFIGARRSIFTGLSLNF